MADSRALTSAFSVEILDGGLMTTNWFGSGPPIVWIHGLGEWSVGFERIASHPVFAGHTHVLLDLPGYGRSPWAGGGIELRGNGVTRAGEALEALADRLAAWLAGWPERRHPWSSLGSPVLLGHSMGGVLAQLIAERIAVRAVIDVEGNLSRGDCVFSARVAAYSADDFAARGLAELRADTYERGRTDPALASYAAAMYVASPQQFHRHARALVELSESETLAARLAALKVPVLYVAGVPNGICERSRELLTSHGIRWVGLGPAAHWVHADQADAFALAVGGFLGELEAQSDGSPVS